MRHGSHIYFVCGIMGMAGIGPRRGLDKISAKRPMAHSKTESNLSTVGSFFPVDLTWDFVLMSDYTGKEVVE